MKREKYEKILNSKQIVFALMRLVYSEFVSILSTLSHKILKNFIRKLRKTQKIIPQEVGIRAARAVHLRLPVSFFIVSRVVEHGQCISIKISTQRAVPAVQPFARKMLCISSRLTEADRADRDR